MVNLSGTNIQLRILNFSLFICRNHMLCGLRNDDLGKINNLFIEESQNQGEGWGEGMGCWWCRKFFSGTEHRRNNE